MEIAQVRRLLSPLAHRLAGIVTLQQFRLRPERAIIEFRNGRYPLLGRLSLVVWQDPEMRAIIPLDDRFHVGKRLNKKVRSGYFNVTFDQAFRQVVECCAAVPGREETWLSRDIMGTYIRLHKYGYAHSVEVWREGRLVGGQFGVAIGSYYSGASRFTIEDDASKVGMVTLVQRLRERGFTIYDPHVMSATTQAFGGYEIPRSEFKALLPDAIASSVQF